jgi:hypothetical protein
MLALAAIALLVGVLPHTVAAGTEHPDVVQVTRLKTFNLTPMSGATVIARLPLPRGRWLVWAESRVRGGDDDATVLCWLRPDGAAEGLQHRGRSVVRGNPPDHVSLQLSIATVASASDASAVLRCRSSVPGPSAVRTSLIGVRAGRLTTVNLATGRETTSGTGEPRVIEGARSSVVDVPEADTLQTVAQIDLPAGRWWVRASFTLQKRGNAAADPTYALCRLRLGDETSDSDEFHLGIEAAHSPTNVVIDIATEVGEPSTAALRCRQAWSPIPPDAIVRDVRITAVRADRLRVVHAVVDGDAVTRGRGAPFVIHGERQGPVAIDGSHPWSTLALIDLPVGTWLVMGTFVTFDGPSGDELECRLRAGGTSDTISVMFSHGEPFQLVSTMRQAGKARLECRQPTDPGERVLAEGMRLSALQVTPLPD